MEEPDKKLIRDEGEGMPPSESSLMEEGKQMLTPEKRDSLKVFERQEDGTFTVLDHPLFEGHFRNYPIVPGVILEELALLDKDRTQAYSFRGLKEVYPGDILEIEDLDAIVRIYRVNKGEKEPVAECTLEKQFSLKNTPQKKPKSNVDVSIDVPSLVFQEPPFRFVDSVAWDVEEHTDTDKKGARENLYGSFVFKKEMLEKLGIAGDIVPRCLVEECGYQMLSGAFSLCKGNNEVITLGRTTIRFVGGDVRVGDQINVYAKIVSQKKVAGKAEFEMYVLPQEQNDTGGVERKVLEGTVIGAIVHKDSVTEKFQSDLQRLFPLFNGPDVIVRAMEEITDPKRVQRFLRDYIDYLVAGRITDEKGAVKGIKSFLDHIKPDDRRELWLEEMKKIAGE